MRQVRLELVVFRVLLVAGMLLIAAMSAEGRPVWRSVPTALPPEVHFSKVRSPSLGPVWRQWASSRIGAASFAPLPGDDTPDTSVIRWQPETPAASIAATAETPPATVATPPVVAGTAEPPPAPVAVASAPAPEPMPVVAKAKPVAPIAPVVVAAKMPDPPSAAPASAPAARSSSAETPWLDYLGALVMAIVVCAAIFFLTRDRQRTA